MRPLFRVRYPGVRGWRLWAGVYLARLAAALLGCRCEIQEPFYTVKIETR